MSAATEGGLLTLANEFLTIEVDPRDGSLATITDARSGWSPAGGESPLSFMLHVPTVERRANFVHGEDQPAPAVELSDSSITLEWDGVRSTLGLDHDIEVTVVITLEGPLVIFGVSLDNRSDCVIESVAAPRLAEVASSARAERLHLISPMYGTAEVREMWPAFDFNVGYWGTFFPTMIGRRLSWSGLESFAPQTPFVLLQHQNRGVYLGVRDFERELVAWWSELRPTYADSMTRAPVDGAHVMFQAVHVPWLEPGEQRTLTPVALQLYEGTWHAGADIHRSWRSQHLAPSEPPEWMQHPHTWHQLHINGPEDEEYLSFPELVDVARETAAAGVDVLEIDGWNVGGQDRNNPSHDPDPRLGGPAALAQAIDEIQALGLKVVLFTKFTWADRARPDYQERFHRHAIKTPHAHENMHAGYPYTTPSQLLGVKVNRLVPMCFYSEDWIEECESEMEKVLAVSPDGILYDECFHHSPAYLCFDSEHGHRLGAPVYAADGPFIKRLKSLNHDPNFFWGGEGLYDFQVSEYSLSYIRSHTTDHLPLSRYLNPRANMLTAVTGFDDRNLVNQALLYRYIVCLEPYGFKGRVTDMTKTTDYTRLMGNVRTGLREWFWDGEFRDVLEAEVERASGERHHPYAVYRGHDTGTLGITIANYDVDATRVRVRTPGEEAGPRVYRTLETEEWLPADDLLEIPGQSAVVVVDASALQKLQGGALSR